jgi:two-component system capsular synthesis sensor histidine kinase RcsC
VRELVQSLCERLQQRGAQASVYREDSAAGLPSSAVLLELVLDDPLPAWAGGPRDRLPRRRRAATAGRWRLAGRPASIRRDRAGPGRGQRPTAGGQRRRRLPATRHFGLQVLVAEDNPINQAILRDQLEQLGCRAVVASDGNEALGYWQQGRSRWC